VFPVVSGTAANALALSAMSPPWGAVLCHDSAHILCNEAGATSMYGGGMQMKGRPGPNYKLNEKSIKAAFASAQWGDNHDTQPTVVSFTCPTDFGTVYTPAEVAVITALARTRGLKAHLDGARIANAIASLHCSPGALTHEAGVDVFSLGAIKGGTMNADAIVSFDREASDQLYYRLKRAGHVSSKMRFQSVQLLAYLRDGLWVKLARQANAATVALARGLHDRGVGMLAEPQANMIFAKLEPHVSKALAAAGVHFYDISPGVVRFVTSWRTTPDEIEDMLRRLDVALTTKKTGRRTAR